MNEYRLSIALITRNLPDLLERCLRSLRSQSIQPFEVVVSDDSEPEYVVANQLIAQKWNCRYLTGTRRGLQANLNNAILACQGTHVRIVNDDHIFPENHFKVLLQAIESDPECIWTLGEYYEMPHSNAILHLPGEVQPRGYHKPITNYTNSFGISGGSATLPRKIFEIHRFLETFGYVCDLEFGPRLSALGYRIRYCPDTYVIHLSEGSAEERIDKRKFVYPKGSFLLAHLTYSCYRPNFLNQVECLVYFAMLAIMTSFKVKNNYFTLTDFWETLTLSNQYREKFRNQEYEQIV
ncbi:glycosyltransferase family 2 protein [Desertifilum sp. FACHB-1129]|uniref:Glycosyltransferase 2-like domain-containing protein n=1 Tax=Desertifilum tharense IPPAS B-1220 TaxID=1781255 RepID=A0A1E5QMN6_9CYAN|nr:glycosyltransferase family 2 protein [Desertifilum tharense]MBD2310990.1 glycosyltransferase family 2 protein [Desertifilum sp. FACHB-1129]MBD2321395.1 glycosyltransferase family 2 protein [Desertifilum sp. FACHB-866]MBD2331298.1 glycosyltransferase family 2 protein [Desertifilum sp. FACHB-868]MDA0208788.1 glycosyltransferase family 2 protein [Cyanobacteria bacterium FC1]OEJ75935.1 hypothetical protein BH720_06545 [Desertifilum tharense IPPAS B-1220]